MTIVPATSKSLTPKVFASLQKNIQQKVLGQHSTGELQSHLDVLVLDKDKGEMQPHRDRLNVLVRLFQAHWDTAATSEQDRKAKTQTSVKMLLVVRCLYSRSLVSWLVDAS